MKYKKWLFIIIPIVLIVIAVLLINYFLTLWYFNPKIYVSIQDDNVYYNMTVNDLIKIKGDPVEEYTETEVSPTQTYCFKENICGFSADSSYTFYKPFLGTRLTNVNITIYCNNSNEAKNLFNDIYERLSKNYKALDNYYNNGIVEISNTEFSAELGINNGATGILNQIIFSDNTLTINTFNQF